MITLVQCVNNLDLGGVEVLALTLARQFRHDRFRTAICCIEDRGPLADQAERDGITVHTLRAAQTGQWNALQSLCRYLHERRPVILHTHNFKPFYYGALARLRGAADVHIQTRHGAFTKTHRAHWRYRLLRRWADELVTVSEDGRHKLSRQTGLPLDKIGVVPNGVDTALFCPAADKPALRRQLGLPESSPAIVTAGRFSPEKDFPTLLRAFSFILRALPDAQLWILGDGGERARLEALARDLNLAGKAHFFGARSDVPMFLQAADLFVLSSVSEGLSVALIESIASGLPVVATDVGGNREIVHPPECGTLVPPQNPSALAEACVKWLQDQKGLATMSAAARLRALEKFSVEQMVRAYETLYFRSGRLYKETHSTS